MISLFKQVIFRLGILDLGELRVFTSIGWCYVGAFKKKNLPIDPGPKLANIFCQLRKSPMKSMDFLWR